MDDETRASNRARQAARRQRLRDAGLSARGRRLDAQPATHTASQGPDEGAQAEIAALRAEVARLRDRIAKAHKPAARPVLKAAEATLLKKAMHPNGSLSEDAAAEAWRLWNEKVAPAFDVTTPEQEARSEVTLKAFKAGAEALDAKRAAQAARAKAKRAAAKAAKGET